VSLHTGYLLIAEPVLQHDAALLCLLLLLLLLLLAAAAATPAAAAATAAALLLLLLLRLHKLQEANCQTHTNGCDSYYRQDPNCDVVLSQPRLQLSSVVDAWKGRIRHRHAKECTQRLPPFCHRVH
jgi:hypothetical protein